jgi:peptidoglycan/LPS O-acetylase OafA/YrhL
LNIQALRGVAALLVLLPHIKNYDHRFAGDRIPGSVGRASAIWELGNAGVDLFFVISGFVMVATTLNRRGASSKPGNFLLRRAARIYPLYWVISLVVAAVYLKNSAMVNAGQKIVMWKSFLLYPQKVAPLVAQGWTLSHEFYFYLVFAVLLMFRESWAPAVLIAWGAIVAAISPLSQRSPELDIIANPLTLEFIAGCFVAFATQRSRSGGGLMLLGGIVLLVLCGTRVTDLHSPWQRVAGFGIPSALIVFGAVTVEHAGKSAPRWLIAIGDASYSLYLTHGLVLAALARWAWEKRHIHTGPVANSLVAFAMAGVAIAGALVCYRLIELPLTALTKKLFDNKKTAQLPALCHT